MRVVDTRDLREQVKSNQRRRAVQGTSDEEAYAEY